VARHDIREAAAANLATHFSYAPSLTAGMKASSDRGLVLASCGMPCDTFNAVSGSRLGRDEAVGEVDRALVWFDGLPFSWWMCPGDSPEELGVVLESRGLEPAESELAMALDLTRLVAPPQVPGLEIERISQPWQLDLFARLLAALWDPPDDNVVEFYLRAGSALLSPESPQRLYLGTIAGEPVATAEATWAGGAAGLYNIATVPTQRGRGIGSAMTARPLQDAIVQGMSLAVLQAAPGAEGVYRRVGFEVFGRVVEYKPS